MNKTWDEREKIEEKTATSIAELSKQILSTDKQYDLSKILSAYQFAEKAHGDQKRSSGEPYIIHPIAVASILVSLGMDTDTVCVGLLHDVVEDTSYTLDDIRSKFGNDVAVLVDGVTKIGKLPIYDKEQQQAHNFCKILLAMSHDIRVIIIKLADRIHNMRTLKYLPPEKQRRIAVETMNIYAPIAHRLGIRTIKEELEDRAFYYLDSYAYAEIEHLMEIKKEEREIFIETIKSRIAERLSDEDFIKTPTIEGRVKSVYGIYRKVYMCNKSMEEIYDKYAVRVIVSTVAECYLVLGIVHDIFRPLQGRFKDYISTPKDNMYQSLHTTVLGKEGIPFEIQIRTWDMHASAEYGIAAHWKYKEGITKRDPMDERLAWIREIIEFQKESDDDTEFLRVIKNDLTPDEVVVMTPKGDTYSFPQDSCIIDFAYRIHTEIGNKTVGGKVNGKQVPLDYKLATGDICEVVTSKDPNKGPNREWLKIVKTGAARSKIRSWFKKECREENIEQGKASLAEEFRRCHIRLPESEWGTFLADDLRRHNCETLEDFYASVGYGGVTLSKIIPRLKSEYVRTHKEEIEEEEQKPIIAKPSSKNCVMIDSIETCEYKFAQCCSPLPGEDIIGFITRGRGLSIHSQNCINYQSALKQNDPDTLARWIPVQWTENTTSMIPTSIELVALDRMGLVFDITKILTENRIQIAHSSSHNLKNGNAFFEASILVGGIDQLNSIIDKLRKISGVVSVERVKVKN